MDEEGGKTLEMVQEELIETLRKNRAEDAKRLLQKYDMLRSRKDDVSGYSEFYSTCSEHYEVLMLASYFSSTNVECEILKSSGFLSLSVLCYLNHFSLANLDFILVLVWSNSSSLGSKRWLFRDRAVLCIAT